MKERRSCRGWIPGSRGSHLRIGHKGPVALRPRQTGQKAIAIVATDSNQPPRRTEAVRTVQFPAANPVRYTYDADGNLLSDGVWTYTWTTECRLVRAEGGNLKAEYVYDGLGRRRIRRLVSWNPQTENWTLSSEHFFTWDSWLLVSERITQYSTTPPTQFSRTYTCGLDLSGQLGGEGQDPMSTAGGIGGILALTSTSSVGGALRAATSVFLYDGNGNVANLADAGGTAAVLATYEYGPFGNTLVASGPLADTNPIRFSTKYLEGAQPPGSSTQPSALIPQPSLYYYGHRYYSPGLGRWVSRDPIGERGGDSLLCFGVNSPITRVDVLGLSPPGFFPSGLCGTVADFGGFGAGDRATLMKARCLTLKLVQTISPLAVPLSPDWSRIHRATATGSCHGLNYDWGGSDGIHIYMFSSVPTESSLIAMAVTGATLLHELHHYYLGSFDDGSVADPKNIYDDPVLSAFGYGLKTPVSGCCSLAGETHPIKNLVQRHACDCKIRFW